MGTVCKKAVFSGDGGVLFGEYEKRTLSCFRLLRRVLQRGKKFISDAELNGFIGGEGKKLECGE